MYLSRVTPNPWSHYGRILALAVPFVALTLGACDEKPPPGGGPGAIYTAVGQGGRNKVDILFMVDNSASMEAMAQELRNRFGQFFTVFEDLAASGTYADLHIGVVTSDYGAGQASGICSNYGQGELGLLQVLGAEAATTCRPPGRNVNYIQYQFGPNGVNNLPPGTRTCTEDSECPSGSCNSFTRTCAGTLPCVSDNDCPGGHICDQQVCIQSLLATFTCMASVGTTGCGFEHVLESVRAALVNPANGDFLRPDALLTVVFLTNEDDCSAPPDSDLFLSTPELNAQYGYRSSYRCTRFGLTCDGQLPTSGATNGPLTCTPSGLSSGGKLYDVQRYIDFFTKPRSQGGIKERPASDVLLVGIDPLPDGTDAPNQIRVLLSDPATPVGQPYVPCTAFDPDSSPACVPVLQHACQNPQQPAFFGDPAVRLNAVINAAPMNHLTSICAGDYTSALQGLGRRVVNLIGTVCITSALADPANPDCKVEDVTQLDAPTAQVRPIPKCDASETTPCWKLEAKPACQGTSPDGLGLTVLRGVTPVPPNTTTRIACVTAQ
jgi:hypothetical protein